MTVVNLAIAVEAVVAVIVTAAAAVTTMGNPEHALDRTHGPANTGADDASNCTADRAADPVAFIRALLGTAHDALGMAGLR